MNDFIGAMAIWLCGLAIMWYRIARLDNSRSLRFRLGRSHFAGVCVVMAVLATELVVFEDLNARLVIRYILAWLMVSLVLELWMTVRGKKTR